MLATTAFDINNQGTIVGDGLTSSFVNRALVWSPAPGGGYTITDLGEGFATGINNAGMIIGGLYTDDPDRFAVVWDRQFNPILLPTLPGGYNGHAPEGINDRGTVVGLVNDADGQIHGAVWTRGPGGDYTIYDLGVDARPLDINNQGTIVGWVETDGPNIPAVWTPAPGRGYTLTLMESYGQAGQATSINEAGQVTGNIRVNDRFVGVLWTPTPSGGYTMTELGRRAHDINNSGQAVGLAPNLHATVWEGLHPGCSR